MDDTQLRIENVRLSFPDIFEAKSLGEGDPKFSCNLLLRKAKDRKEEGEEEVGDDADQILLLKKTISAVAKAKWPGKSKELFESGKLKICIHECSTKDYDGYDADHMYLSASSTRRPLVVDRDRTPLVLADGKPYAGCYVDAVVRLWAQDNRHGKRVNAELMGVQFVKDGEPFGAGPITADAFADRSEGEEKTKPAKKAAAKSEEGDDNEMF